MPGFVVAHGGVGNALKHVDGEAKRAEDLGGAPRGPAGHGDLPPAAGTPRGYEKWGKAVATWLYDTQAITLQEHAASGTYSTPGETEAAFRARLSEALRVVRDARIDAIRTKYAAKLQTQLLLAATAINLKRLTSRPPATGNDCAEDHSAVRAQLAILNACLRALAADTTSTSTTGS